MANFSKVKKLIDLQRTKIEQPRIEYTEAADILRSGVPVAADTPENRQRIAGTTDIPKVSSLRKWVTSQEDAGIRRDAEGQPVYETADDVAKTEEGRRLGSMENIRKALKGESIGATQHQKRAGQVLSKKVRQDLVEDYATTHNYTTKLKRKLVSEAGKNQPETEGTKLAAKLMRVIEEKNINDIALNKDATGAFNKYKESIYNVVNRRHGKTLDDDVKALLLDNLDEFSTIGLEAIQKNYSRGLRGIGNYEAPSLSTSIFSSGEHALDRLAQKLGLDVDHLDDVTRRDIENILGSIVEEASDEAGFTHSVRSDVPRARRQHPSQKEEIKREPISLEFRELIESFPNASGQGSLPSFTRPFKYTPKNAKNLVKTHNKAIKKEVAQNEKILDTVNDIQSVPYSINKQTLNNIQQLHQQGKLTTQKLTPEQQARWKELNGKIAGANRFLDNLPPKKYWSEKQAEVAERIKPELREYHLEFEPLNKQFGKSVDEETTIGRAAAFAEHDLPFFYRTELGDNFRMYYTTPLINPQGSPVGRGVLQFGEGHALTKQGVENTKVEAASYIELPDQKVKQLTPAERLKYFDDNEDFFTRVGEDPVGTYDEWAPLVDDKNRVSFMNAVQDYSNWKRDPYFKSHRIAAADAVTSGIQIISALLDDHTISKLVKLVDSDIKGDLYLHFADETNKVLQKRAADGDEVARSILGNKELWAKKRKAFKRPTMIIPYGSGAKNIGETIADDLASEGIFLDSAEAAYLGKLIDTEITQIVPALGVFKSIVKKLTADLFTPTTVKGDYEGGTKQVFAATKPTFRLEEGFPFQLDYPTYDLNREVTHFGGEQAQLYRRTRSEFVSPERKSKAETALMAKLVHFLDATLLHRVAKEMKAQGIHQKSFVHDQFATHPNNVDDMLGIIRKVMKQMFGGKNSEGTRMLEKIISEATDQDGNLLYDVREFNELLNQRGQLDIDETIDTARPFDFG